MASSYVERLIWKYFKENVFGGFKGFIDRSSFPLTLLVLAVLAYEYVYKIRPGATVLIAMVLISAGIILWKRPISARVTVPAAILLGILWFASTRLGLEISIEYLSCRSMLLGTMFLWYLFNASMFIIQTADFFASTAGILILYGSDRDRVFLSPLELLASSLVLGLAVWRLRARLLDLAIVVASISIILMFIYVIMKGKGRILRSAYGMFTFVAVFSMIGFVMGLSATVNATVWIVITIFSLLFAIQNYTRTLVREKKVGMKYGFLAFLGLILLVAHLITKPDYTVSVSIRDIWLLSILATSLAPITATAYFYATGKVIHYVKRSSFTWKTVIQEVSVALGTYAIKELSSIIWRELTKFLGRTEE